MTSRQNEGPTCSKSGLIARLAVTSSSGRKTDACRRRRCRRVRSLTSPSPCCSRRSRLLGRRDGGADERDQQEQQGEHDREAEQQLVNAAAGLEDGARPAEDAAQPGAARLEQDGYRQCDRHDDLHDPKVLAIWREKTHGTGPYSTASF